MSFEDPAARVEATVVGAKQFVLAVAATVWWLLARPRRLVAHVAAPSGRGAVLGPHAFLVVCAIGLGLLGRVLAGGLEHADLATVLQLKDLRLSSFLVFTVAVFAVALVSSWGIDIALGHHDAGLRQQVKDLCAYVIGFFGIGSVGLLVMLALLLKVVVAGGVDFSQRAAVFELLALAAIGCFVLAMFALLQWMSLQMLHLAEGAVRRSSAWRLALAHAVTVGLCMGLVLSPPAGTPDARPLRGTVVDIELQRDGPAVRLALMLENATDWPIVLNQADGHRWTFRHGPGRALEADGSFGADCARPTMDKPLLVIDPHKTVVVLSCVQGPALSDLLHKAGFTAFDRVPGRARLQPTRPGELEVDVTLRMSTAGRPPSVATVPVAGH